MRRIVTCTIICIYKVIVWIKIVWKSRWPVIRSISIIVFPFFYSIIQQRYITISISCCFFYCCRRIRTRICIIRLQHQITLLHRLHRSVPVAGNRNIHFLAGFHRIMIGQRHRKHRIGIAAGTGDLIHLLIIGAFFCIQCHVSSGICTQNAMRIPLHLVPVPVPALGQLSL